MTVPLVVHVAAGACGLATGFLALGAAKGSLLHRRSGLLFVYVMVVMALLGTVIAATMLAQGIRKPALDTTVFMGLLTAYLVVTALTTVRTPGTWPRRLDLIGLPLATAVGIGLITLGVRALTIPDARQASMITWVEFIFGSVALLAAASDLRILRSVPLTGSRRIARHLWRMTFALLIAVFSFTPRLDKFIPKSFGPVWAVPILVVLIALIYSMWRVRFRNSLRGLIGLGHSPSRVAER
ncbi:MAG: hypothetical protein ABI664_20620 [bacterium]